MSTIVQKQKQPSVEVSEPNKKVKRSWVLRAVDSAESEQRFFEVNELEKAKQWLLDLYLKYNDACSVDFYIEKCTTDGSEPFKVFELSYDHIIWMNNKRIVKSLQSAVTDQLNDQGVQKILEYLEASKLILKTEHEKEEEEEEDSDSD